MFLPVIYVFTQNGDVLDLVNFLDQSELAYLVDSKHGDDIPWMRENLLNPHLMIYKIGDRYLFGTVDQMDKDSRPLFIVTFNNGDIVEEDMFECIFEFFKWGGVGDIGFGAAKRAQDYLIKTKKCYHEAVEEESFEIVKDYYDLEMKYIENADIMIYQLDKPNTDRPYTVVQPNYKTLGHFPFFSSLFIDPSFGLAQADCNYLGYLWQRLEMNGQFDLEKIVIDRTKDGNPEPILHREPIEAVIKIIESGAINIVSEKVRKRTEEYEQRKKFIK